MRSPRSRAVTALAICATTALAVACGGASRDGAARGDGDAASAPAGGGDDVVVRMIEGAGDPRTSWAFEPAAINVAEGETVTFVNAGGEVHTATAQDGTFDTGTLSAGDEARVTFDRSGSYTYHCTLHPWMTGEVTVTTSE